jgi:hypothetical protein
MLRRCVRRTEIAWPYQLFRPDRAGFDVALLVPRPEGAATNQPRASPWGNTLNTEIAALKGRNSPVQSGEPLVRSVLHHGLRCRGAHSTVPPFQGLGSLVIQPFPRALPSLLPTSQPSPKFASGPNVSHAHAKSCIRWRPIQRVCVPGSLCGRLTYPPRLATRWTISASRGDCLGGCLR